MKSMEEMNGVFFSNKNLRFDIKFLLLQQNMNFHTNQNNYA